MRHILFAPLCSETAFWNDSDSVKWPPLNIWVPLAGILLIWQLEKSSTAEICWLYQYPLKSLWRIIVLPKLDQVFHARSFIFHLDALFVVCFFFVCFFILFFLFFLIFNNNCKYKNKGVENTSKNQSVFVFWFQPE